MWQGGDLFDLIIQTPKGFLDEVHTQWFFRQICEAVYYLHENDVIHRDIKIENVLITKKNGIPDAKVSPYMTCPLRGPSHKGP